MKSVFWWESLASHSHKEMSWKTFWPQHDDASSHSIQSEWPQSEERISLSQCILGWSNAEAIGMGWERCVSLHTFLVFLCLSGRYYAFLFTLWGYWWCVTCGGFCSYPAGFLINSPDLWSDYNKHSLAYRKLNPRNGDTAGLESFIISMNEQTNQPINQETKSSQKNNSTSSPQNE